MRRPLRSALLALLILCWGASPVTAQTPVTRPAISEEVSPVQEFSVETPDGPPAVGVLRRPPGPGPFPAVLITHPYPVSQWRTMALNNATMTRFLAAGYVTVMHAAPSELDGFPREGPVTRASNLAAASYVKNLSDVDSNSVVLYGCSTGGGMVLMLAAETDVAAVAAEEPGGFGYDFFNNDSTYLLALQDPHRFFTPEIRLLAQERFRTISGPIFLARGGESGDVASDFSLFFQDVMFPDLKASGKEFEAITYSGQEHCFGFFATAGGRVVANDGAAASEFFADMDAFFKRHLPTQPRAVDDSLIQHVVIEPVPVSSETVPERIAITVSSEILADYVGTYELLLLGFDLVLTLKDDRLMGEAPGFGKFQLFAESETDFFNNENNYQWEFVRGEDGIVTYVIVRSGSNEMTAPRKSNDR